MEDFSISSILPFLEIWSLDYNPPHTLMVFAYRCQASSSASCLSIRKVLNTYIWYTLHFSHHECEVNESLLGIVYHSHGCNQRIYVRTKLIFTWSILAPLGSSHNMHKSLSKNSELNAHQWNKLLSLLQ